MQVSFLPVTIILVFDQKILQRLRCGCESRNKHYPALLKDYGGDIVLVGISYNDKTKKHTCRIEKIPTPTQRVRIEDK